MREEEVRMRIGELNAGAATRLARQIGHDGGPSVERRAFTFDLSAALDAADRRRGSRFSTRPLKTPGPKSHVRFAATDLPPRVLEARQNGRNGRCVSASTGSRPAKSTFSAVHRRFRHAARRQSPGSSRAPQRLSRGGNGRRLATGERPWDVGRSRARVGCGSSGWMLCAGCRGQRLRRPPPC